MMSSIWVLKATGGERLADLTEVRRALSILGDPARAFQLQAAPRWAFRTFTLAGGLDDAVAWVAGEPTATGIYYALNPVPANLADRVKVPDVLARRWLLIDVDRAKANDNKELSATEEEHERARTLALDVKDHLDGLGWPAPCLVDSGNGFHLLYRVDLPNDNHSRILVKGALDALARQFDGPRGLIGKECHDARRIAKLPGTWARKGTHTPERPHRMCRLLHAPDDPQVVPVALLQALAGSPPPNGKDGHAANGNGNGKSPFVLSAEAGSDQAYARAALERECGRMALTTPGDLNNQLFRSAAALGNLVPHLLNEQEVVDALTRAGHQAGCDNPEKDLDTIRRGLEAGKATPRKKPEKNGQTAPATAKPATPRTPPRIMTCLELMGEVFPEPRWAVPGILSEGLTFLAGKPKLGKSWLALNLALTIANGGKALGTTNVLPGDVLYLSLEDRWRRVQDRARKVLTGMSREASRRLHIAVEWPRQDQGGLEALTEWIRSVERPVLVVIDTWARFRPASKGQRSAYEQDYEQVVALKAIMDQAQVSCMPVHHCKKAAAEDVVDELSGTLGLAGASDGTLVLTRSRSENDAEMFCTGRDIEEKSLALQFDPKTFVWSCLGSAEERSESKYKQALIEIFKANPGVGLSARDLCERLRVPEERYGAVRMNLTRLMDSGLIEKAGYGKYRWPIQPAQF